PALAIADDHERGETEALTALHGLGNAVDVDELFDQLLPLILTATATAIVTTTTATAATTATAIATVIAAATSTTTASAPLFAALSLIRGNGNIRNLFSALRFWGVVFVSHHQNSSPP